MSGVKRPLGGTGAIAACVVLVGAGFLMGRKELHPSRWISRLTAPDDSLRIAQRLHQRCGRLGGEPKVACYAGALDSLAARGEVRVAIGALEQIGALDQDVKRERPGF